MGYCTVPEVLNRMGHAGAASTDLQARISDAIDAVTEGIEDDTDRVFAASSETRTFKTHAGSVLYLPDFTAITTLKFDDDDDGTFETTIASTAYELGKQRDRTDWPYDRVRLLDRSLPSGGRREYRIQVVGTFGWAAVPSAINQACSLMAARISQRTSAALFGTQSFGDLGAASIRSTDPDYLRLIGPYRKPQVA